MKVMLVIHSLASGGAERVMTHMANHWVGQGVEVALVTLYTREDDFYPLAPGVVRYDLNMSQSSPTFIKGIANNLRRMLALRAALKKIRPDGVVSFMPETNILTLLAAWMLGIPVVVSERTDPTQVHIGTQWELLRRLSYRRAAAVVVQTHNVARWAHTLADAARVVVIPNPVYGPTEPVARPDADSGTRVVAALGRLQPAKGFDLLIRAFALCSVRYPAWQLHIHGEGRLRAELETLVNELGLAGRVALPGTTRQPLAKLQKADLFVLSSRHEGFPNALLEAMACGLPVVAFDCRSGPADIVEDGCNGLLVPAGDVEQLAAAMARLMGDAALRDTLGRAASQVTDKYAIGSIMAQWDAVLARGKAC